jgi:ABC-2 type transport system ATP-binding protein
MLESRGLALRYKDTEALRGLDLAIPSGTVVGLVGPNGAGKTTFLHLAVGLLRPTAGEIHVLGMSPTKELTRVLSRVGFVAQDLPLYRGFSVADTLELGRRLNPTWDAAAARERLEALEIDPTRPVGKLSGGQQAQVALSLAIGKRPDLLLLDEPVAHLDPLARRQFLSDLVDAVGERGIGVVLSSHLVTDLERVCNYLVILSRGEVQLAGEVDQLLRQHSLLIGHGAASALPDGADAISSTHSGAVTTTVVRWRAVEHGASVDARPIDLEELVLAYLASPART